ncbi:PEP-CTERM sorting domain-containing protein [Methylicorpusculum sp.]|uniref:PEP-CTERM sorting domain-containing protein n=1 Tax=Methylicorpusculum sp. TaxID=2713644 RepID=UPI0027288FD1|nr:PEP-CTERM sorting domain-containing protein [Methylicorpusculum sp.]MDO9239754.1 PEP-CTERM sorting domain-containing protein [Methylicorpusculum sp.]MDP2178942.1 PEP-CTERM sorting domain-containing protein [Methylicorpusculum sp.]MDP3530955.1 PEP-CTERM sorting domain-containing protein [Methylicorpusculum sp.]MDZ4150985.1 PEP-CTERM sorting domain-containing protein [Methylicorpusculum sp.]
MIKNTAMILALFASSMLPVQASITVDGNLSDWGIKRNGNANDWTPNPGIHFTVEDQTGKLSDYLNPGYGGQAYDAEALYAYLTDTHLFIAMATGHNPNTPNDPSKNSYGAGDFAIDFGLDGTYEAGINVKPDWDTFGVANGLYKVDQWAYGLWNDTPGYLKSEHPTAIMSGTLLGIADMVISSAQTGYGQWSSDTHYFYEIGLSLDLLRQAGWNGSSFNIHWTQMCANDSIIVDPPANVPEAGSLMLMSLGLFGMSWAQRKKTGF